jgi:phage gp29-like protein
MVARTVIRDANDQPVDMKDLTVEDGAPTVMGVRQVRMDHPSYRMSPESMAMIMRNSETIDASRFFSLCMDVEERETHYRGVLSTRKTQVSQVPITVEAAKVPDGEKHAQAVRDVVEAVDFPLKIVDMLDGLGKGISWTEMVWDISEGQAVIQKIKWRDPRWFRFDIGDLETGLLLDEGGQPQPLKPFKWIVHQPKLQSGIPVRNGLTRCAAYGWMFKNFAIKDWLIYLDVFGMPLRLGKYPQNATAAEKRALLTAVSNLGSDAAAIIPAAMTIDFPGGSGAVSAAGSPFKEMATYFDEQASKLVLGQTGTTDAVAGGSRGLGAVQNAVRGDIERSDGVQLGATLSRDIAIPVVALNFGPQKRYPRIFVGYPEDKDLAAFSEMVKTFVPMGLKVSERQVRDQYGVEEPAAGDTLLVAPPPPAPMNGAVGTPPPDPRAETSGGGGADDTGAEQGAPPETDADDDTADGEDPATILAAQETLDRADPDWADKAVAALIAENGWVPDIGDLQEALAKCKTMEEAQTVLAGALDTIGLDKFAELLAKIAFNARGAGITNE